ncbi:MAG: histidine kinase [Lachnospiraceae bacterium]|nr:histidine kinase [Lachnospiraceae bacterium]
MSQMVLANIALDLVGIVLSVIPIIYLLDGHRYRQKLNQYFLGVCVSNLFMIIGDLPDWLIQDASQPSMQMAVSLSTSVFYAASAFVLYFFGRYIFEYLKLSGRAKKVCLSAVVAVCSIQLFFAVISPFTGSVFYVTDSGYQRGELFWVSQVVPAFCYFLFTVLVIVYRKRLAWREVVFFLLYIFVPLGGGAAQMFLRGIAVVNIGVALALLFILVNIQFEHELLIKRQEKELAEDRIAIMLSQIQPHFLYNSLTAIRRLCDHDPQQAKAAIADFSLFLRANMDSLSSRAPIPFEQELLHTRHYLALEQQRFQSRLQVVYDIVCQDFALPPLTLQPIAENAVRHGILRRENGGTVTISTVETVTAYMVIVADDGAGFQADTATERRSHIGIENVRSRLATLCGGTLDIQSTAGRGTSVTITIPKEV